MVHHKTLIRQTREESILLSLKKLDYLTTSQLIDLHGLKSKRNALRVLNQMTDYVSTFKNGENVYHLNAKGREAVNCEKVRKKTLAVDHFIMRNNLYMKLNKPADWRSEIRIISKGKSKREHVGVTADAVFSQGGRWHVVEVDNTQSMKNNAHKIKRYRILCKRGAFGQKPPLFIWLTKTEYRKKRIIALCEGLECKVFTQTDLN